MFPPLWHFGRGCSKDLYWSTDIFPWWMGISPENNTHVKTGLTLMNWCLYWNLCMHSHPPRSTRMLQEASPVQSLGPIFIHVTQEALLWLVSLAKSADLSMSWRHMPPDESKLLSALWVVCLISVFGQVTCDGPRMHDGPGVRDGQGALGSEAVDLYFSFAPNNHATWAGYLTSLCLSFLIKKCCFL